MDPKVFGMFVQTRRKDLGMNQNQLAEKLHVTAKAVSRWERGVGFPSIELLQQKDVLEISCRDGCVSSWPVYPVDGSDLDL